MQDMISIAGAEDGALMNNKNIYIVEGMDSNHGPGPTELCEEYSMILPQ